MKMGMDDVVVVKANMSVVWKLELVWEEERATGGCENGSREDLL